MSIWKHRVTETTKGCILVSEGSQGRPALHSAPPPPLPPSASPLHAHPYFAHYVQTSPAPCKHSAKCLFINFHSPLSEKVITTAILLVCISVSVSLSQLCLSPHTQACKHTYFFLLFLFFFFFVPFPSLKAKWSEHPSCIVSLGAKELRGLPKCQIYNSPLLGHTASGHVSAFLLTLFSPEPLFLPQTTTPPQIHLYNLIAQVYKNG